MYEIRTAVQQSLFKAIIKIEKPIYELSGGKLAKNRFLSSVKIPHVGTNVRIVKETENSTYIAKFNPDGTYDNSDFRILCTTDLHLDDDYDLNDRTLQHLADRIADLKPDLVVFTGDTILSKYQQIDAIQFAAMMEQIGVYWAYVFGNHEAREEKGPFKYLLYKSLIDSPYCLCKYGNLDLFGFGNFTVNIMNGENSILKSLVMLDSGRSVIDAYRVRDGVPADIDGYDYVKPSQIKWYTDEMDSLKKQYGDVGSMIYLHIPLPEYDGFFEQQPDGTYVPKADTELIYGTMRETVGCPEFNSGLFEAMKQNGGQAIFCGHDHCNDFCVKKDGIYIVYNQTGGYNCYRLYEQERMSPDESTWHFGVNFTDIAADGTLSFGHRRHTEY
ncbi:MAG: metallophosphoesterase [Clostridia bacterium]|nr:metallophosphoesterase [Clostridia bacterium]